MTLASYYARGALSAILAAVWAALCLEAAAQSLDAFIFCIDESGGELQSNSLLLGSVAFEPVEATAIDEEADGITTSLLVAMAAIESGHDSSAVGDGGRAIGVYQIHPAYWKDSGVPGRWEDCRNPAYARRVILAYWKRYCPDALRNGDLEVLSRVHNGGPRGHKKKKTVAYWRKIQAVSA